MDYLTRRAAAAVGHRGALIRGRSTHPRISALGVRVEHGSVRRAEISQALADLRITVEIPAGDRVAAEAIEGALADFEPEQLRNNIDAFLDKLATEGSQASPLAPPNGHTSWLAYAVATMDDRSLQNDHDAGHQPQWPADVTRDQMRSAAAAELKECEQRKRRKLLDAAFDEINAAGLYKSSPSYTGDQRSALPPNVLKAGLEVFTTEEAVRQWLNTTAGAWAGGRTPQQLIHEGREADVVGALKGLAHGNFL